MGILSNVDLVLSLSNLGYEQTVDYDFIVTGSVGNWVSHADSEKSLQNIEWLNQTDPKPTAQELVDSYDNYISSKQLDEQLSNEIAVSMLSIPIERSMINVIAKINEDVAKNFLQGNQITIEQAISVLNSRLSENPTLRDAVFSYVETVNSEPVATLNLTAVGKGKIWSSSMAYMTVISLTWLARGSR